MSNPTIPSSPNKLSDQQALSLVISLAEQGAVHAADTPEQYEQWCRAIDQIKATCIYHAERRKPRRNQCR